MYKSKTSIFILVFLVIFSVFTFTGCSRTAEEETGRAGEQDSDRMDWWREARFGLFIHWGLYAVPAGEWKGETNHAEWILTTAQIPVAEYEEFASQFNPVKFDAAGWVRMAKNAGMKYIVITSKHHDGFSLFDSAQTGYDIMDATPFQRDILRELSDECRKQGLKMCWYHSIMDWNHPDYLPRRNWEDRSVEGVDFDRYVSYMKEQVRELLENYGEIGVLWFDGEWERTWTPDRGVDLYDYVRDLQPSIIINNRVGKGRAGMAGTYEPAAASGDFGTPEQEIPATGLGYDWETCMTMNDHWGFNKNDDNWKSSEELVRMLADIASKGGNFLLNVGPTAEGLFPDPSIKRLADIGRWMKVNGESIYGTTASLFENLDWGRSTTKSQPESTILYFHVFDWPENGKLQIPGLLSRAEKAVLLPQPENELPLEYEQGSVIIQLPSQAPDPAVSVVAVHFSSPPEVVRSPVITAETDIFVGKLRVEIENSLASAEVRYTLDGSPPTEASALSLDSILLEDTATVKCQIFRDGLAVSRVVERVFERVEPRTSEEEGNKTTGLKYSYFEGEWDKLPDFSRLFPVESGKIDTCDISAKQQPEFFGFQFLGFIRVPEDAVYRFSLISDDGSCLWIGEELVVNNDGLHGSLLEGGRIALRAGFHPIRVEYFQKTGGMDFEARMGGPGSEMEPIPAGALFHRD